jgi:hypothetical protein
MGKFTEFTSLRNASFDDFVQFLFDRTVDSSSKAPKTWDPWHWYVSVEFESEMICSYYVKLFHDPRFLLTRFSKDQLEEGFWAIQGDFDCSASRLIDDETLPITRRADLIRSMWDLFQHLFVDRRLETSVQMWWDSFCYDWQCGVRKRERGGEDLQLQDILFETLCRVLAIDSEICQDAALHGLGHLHHPDTRNVIHQFIEEHPDISKERKRYAIEAAYFEVL